MVIHHGRMGGLKVIIKFGHFPIFFIFSGCLPLSTGNFSSSLVKNLFRADRWFLSRVHLVLSTKQLKQMLVSDEEGVLLHCNTQLPGSSVRPVLRVSVVAVPCASFASSTTVQQSSSRPPPCLSNVLSILNYYVKILWAGFWVVLSIHPCR